MTLLSLDDYCQHTQLSRSTVKALLKKGLPHGRVGKLYRIDPESADAWLMSGGADLTPKKRTKRT